MDWLRNGLPQWLLGNNGSRSPTGDSTNAGGGNPRSLASFLATGLLVGIPTGLLASIYALQTRLIYIPTFPTGSRQIVWKPDRFGWQDWEEVWLRSADGTRLHAYWMPTHDAECTILYFHVQQIEKWTISCLYNNFVSFRIYV